MREDGFGVDCVWINIVLLCSPPREIQFRGKEEDFGELRAALVVLPSKKLAGNCVAAEINRGRRDIRREEFTESISQALRREIELRSLVIPLMISVVVA
jgi:hypothetical protein